LVDRENTGRKSLFTIGLELIVNFTIFSLLAILGFSPLSHAAGAVSYSGNCVRVKTSARMQRCISEISRVTGKSLSVSNCQRSRATQVQLWRKYGGDRNRVGHPDTDQHVVGVAADFRPFAERVKQCKILDQVRSACNGGVGGVGSYKNSGSAHFDIRGWRAQWNVCRNILGASGKGPSGGGGGWTVPQADSERVDNYKRRKQKEVAEGGGRPSRRAPQADPGGDSPRGRRVPAASQGYNFDMDRWNNLFTGGRYQ
jgi:hypothetical protein